MMEKLEGFVKEEKGAISIGSLFTLAIAIVFVLALADPVATNTTTANTSLAGYSAAQGIVQLMPFLYVSIPAVAIVNLLS